MKNKTNRCVCTIPQIVRDHSNTIRTCYWHPNFATEVFCLRTSIFVLCDNMNLFEWLVVIRRSCSTAARELEAHFRKLLSCWHVYKNNQAFKFLLTLALSRNGDKIWSALLHVYSITIQSGSFWWDHIDSIDHISIFMRSEAVRLMRSHCEFRHIQKKIALTRLTWKNYLLIVVPHCSPLPLILQMQNSKTSWAPQTDRGKV